MQTMKIMTLCRNKKINTTRKHWYAFLYAVSLPSDPQQSPKRAFYVAL